MESLLRSLNYDLQFDKEAQHILENSRSHTNSIALTSTPTITTLETVGSHHGGPATTSDFLQKLGASIINSIQLQTSPLNLPNVAVAATAEHAATNMDYSLTPHQVIIDSQTYDSAMGELQKQVEYDQFMNEVWIGIVLILILISMVFCFCSCFLYHQFRVWKNNYRTTIVQNNDDDSVKINLDLEDPVPEYTLVSGLPSYEAALELLHKNPQSCLIVHPSVFEVFNRTEKSTTESTAAHSANAMEAAESQHSGMEASTPLLSEPTAKTPQFVIATLPSYQEANAVASAAPVSPLPYNHSFTSISLINEKSPSQLTEKCPKSPAKSQKS